MEDIDPAFAEKIAPGDLIVAGENFGCGSSREHAPLALKGAFCGGVIAVSFARIFYRNAINVGFPIFECPEAKSHIQEGDILTVCPSSGTIGVERTGEILHFAPFPPFLEGLISSGGLIPFVRKELKMGRKMNMRKHKIATIAGDGIGPEVISEAKRPPTLPEGSSDSALSGPTTLSGDCITLKQAKSCLNQHCRR